jgi:hypothetical protein
VATKLDKPLRRELDIGGQPFVVTISPEGFSASITGDMRLEPSRNNSPSKKKR